VPAEDKGESVEAQEKQVEGCYQQVALQRMETDPSHALVCLLPL